MVETVLPDVVNLLPDSIANQIAAGEVVQRPSSVVKELLENSLDAGANEIVLQLQEGGKQLISVRDNGCGLSWADARLCFERHATSKIHEAHDLESIATMGFRGEALASIAAVAEVEVESRRPVDEVGTQVTISGSKFEGQWPVTLSPGTCFTVRNLFFNVPGRRRFLKNVSVELKHAVLAFQRVALAHPEVSFRMEHDGTLLYNLMRGNRFQRIEQLFGSRIESQLLPVDVESSGISIQGFLGKPSAAKKRSGEQFFFVNGRFMRSSYLHRAVMRAYEHLVSADQIPGYFLFFTLDPGRIDVNIHPAKTEVKFEDERFLWQILNATVREALGRNFGMNRLDFKENPLRDIHFYPKSAPLSAPEVESFPGYNPFHNPEDLPSTPRRAVGHGARTREEVLGESVDYSTFELTDDVAEGLLPATEGYNLKADATQNHRATLFSIPRPEQPVPTGGVKVMQLFNSYIITPLSSGIALIHQHRAHFRILYDAQPLHPATAEEAGGIPLLYPCSIPLTTTEALGVEGLVETARSLGVILEVKGGNELILKALPTHLSRVDHQGFLEELLAMHLSQEGVGVAENLLDHWRTVIAERAAVAQNTPLDADFLEELLHQLFICQQPHVDPYGQPILLMVSAEQFQELLLGKL